MPGDLVSTEVLHAVLDVLDDTPELVRREIARRGIQQYRAAHEMGMPDANLSHLLRGRTKSGRPGGAASMGTVRQLLEWVIASREEAPDA